MNEPLLYMYVYEKKIITFYTDSVHIIYKSFFFSSAYLILLLSSFSEYNHYYAVFRFECHGGKNLERERERTAFSWQIQIFNFWNLIGRSRNVLIWSHDCVVCSRYVDEARALKSTVERTLFIKNKKIRNGQLHGNAA